MQCNLTNIINMGHIETYTSVLSTVELIMRLKQDRGKWRVIFHTCIKLFRPTPVYVCLYYISGLKWSTTHSTQISQNQDRVLYMQSWKQCALPVITRMALWQLMHLGTWWTMLQPYILIYNIRILLEKNGKLYTISRTTKVLLLKVLISGPQ